MWLTNEIFLTNISDIKLNKNYWYNKIIEKHKSQIYGPKTSHNFFLNEEFKEFTDILVNCFHKISEKEYIKFFGKYKILPQSKNLCWAYVSNKNDYRIEIHNHIKTSIINLVFYFNIPSNNSGGISFYNNQNEKFLTYQPKNYDLLIFPNYLLHRPEKINTNKYRISINMEIICEKI